MKTTKNILPLLLIAMGGLAPIACKKKSRPITIEASGSDNTSVVPTNTNNGSFQLVGDGYDIFTGDPRGNCLAISPERISVEPMRRTESKIDILKTKKQLVSRLDNTFSINGGLSFGPESKYELNAGLKSKKINELTVNTNELVAITELTYSDRIARVNTRAPDLNEQGASLIKTAKDYFDFREDCGDRYVSEAIFGSRLLLVVKARYKDSVDRTIDELGVNLELVLGDLLGGGSSTPATPAPTPAAASLALQEVVGEGCPKPSADGVADPDEGNGTINIGNNRRKEACEALQEAEFDVYCLSEGSVNPTLCTDFGVDFSAENLISEITVKFKAARQAFAAGLNENTEFRTRLSVGLSVYNEARSILKSSEDDLSGRVGAVNQLYYVLEDVRENCQLPTADKPTCNEATAELEDLIYTCSKQEEWQKSCQQVPNAAEFRSKYSSILVI